MFWTALLALARNPAIMSNSIDETLVPCLFCIDSPRFEHNESADMAMRMRLLQQMRDARPRSDDGDCRNVVAMQINFSFCQMGKWGLIEEKYGSIMASKIANGGVVGGDLSLTHSPSPCLTRRSIFRCASEMHSLNVWLSLSHPFVILSLILSMSDSRDVDPKDRSSLLWPKKNRPRGRLKSLVSKVSRNCSGEKWDLCPGGLDERPTGSGVATLCSSRSCFNDLCVSAIVFFYSDQ